MQKDVYGVTDTFGKSILGLEGIFGLSQAHPNIMAQPYAPRPVGQSPSLATQHGPRGRQMPSAPQASQTWFFPESSLLSCPS